jgi:hypothetical protein
MRNENPRRLQTALAAAPAAITTSFGPASALRF